MAAWRHARKPVFMRAGGSAAAAVALFGALVSALPTGAATTEYVVVDRNSGLAISGFDPIAYFTDRAAILGRGEFEHRHAGAVWRFRNSGNRSAFAANPGIYMPRFGGYDPVGVARGVAVPGDPHIWLIADERLYLFHSPESKSAFGADAGRAIATADKAWASVQLTLSP